MPDRRHILHESFQLADVLIMLGALLAASVASNALRLESVFRTRITVTDFLLLAGLALGWHLTFSAFGLYRSRRLGNRWSELGDVVKATSLGTLIGLGAAVLAGGEMAARLTPRFLVAFWLVATVATVVSRLLLRSVLAEARLNGHNLRNVLIVGTSDRAWRFAEKVRAKRDLGYHLLGFADEDWPGLASFETKGGPRVTDLEGLPRYLRENVVDEVVMALPLSAFYSRGEGVVRLCEEQGITVRVPSDIFSMSVARAKIDVFQGDPVITLKTGAMNEGWRMSAKRALDFAVALTLLVALAPLLLVVALAVKLTSPGPVFFFQERVGLGKRRFKVFKFRTMVVDAEARLGELEALNEVSGPVFKITRDPRITPIGRFLRKTSIDELPQLLNVLQGHMSLVGPRPLPVRDYEGFSEDWQRRRFSVRPGLTCTWQVSGRSGIPFERWMEMDLEYIDQWSLWLDVKILFRTIPAVLRGTGAA